MSQPGFGVMLRQLGGRDGLTPEQLEAVKNGTVKSMEVDDDRLTIHLTNGGVLTLDDRGQSCCEYRYMRSDDNPEDFVGAKIADIAIEDGPDIPDGEAHEVQFLRVITDKGTFVCSAHNEHNGYYGGFSIEASYSGPVKE